MKAGSYLITRLFLVLFELNQSDLLAQQLPYPPPLDVDDPKGLKLGPGVPRLVDTNGNVIAIDISFTTVQYQDAALSLMLQEANLVAKDMQLPENLPITVPKIKDAYVSPFGFSYRAKAIGNITTTNYMYCFARDYKFSQVEIASYDQTCVDLKKRKWRLGEMDTNGAYQLATQWLSSAKIDVNGLNRDCDVHVALSPYWNEVGVLGQKPRERFVPIYFVWWTSPENEVVGYGDVAHVELYLPEKKLLQLAVDNPEYILRKPLVVTNLASLFPGKARIDVLTNFVPYAGPPVTARH